MGITLAHIANNTAQITLPVGGETVTVVYYPGRVTEKTIQTLQSFSTMNGDDAVTQFVAFNVALAGLIKSWDVYEDDAQTTMFPVDPVRLSELPIAFRIQVVGAIMQDIRPEALAPQS